jgi:hypothetical protein
MGRKALITDPNEALSRLGSDWILCTEIGVKQSTLFKLAVRGEAEWMAITEGHSRQFRFRRKHHENVAANQSIS